MATREPYGGTRREMNRAIRRLNILEWVMLGAAAVVALLGGWLIAWLVRDLGLPFRATWTLASVLLFAVPGVSMLVREAGGLSRVGDFREPAEADGPSESEGGSAAEPKQRSEGKQDGQ